MKVKQLTIFLMVLGIMGWSSLFAFTGFEVGSQELGGVIQVWGKAEEENHTSSGQETTYLTSFEMRTVTLWLEGEIVPGYFGYHVEAAFMEELDVTDAYITINATRYLDITAGRFHPEFTLYGPAAVNELEAPYDPLLNEYMGPGSQIGIQMTRRSRFVQLHVGAFNGSDGPDAWNDSTSSKDALVRADVTLLDWTRFVLQGMYGTEALDEYTDGEHLLAGVAVRIDWEMLLHLRAEWIRRWREVLDNVGTREQVSEGILLHLGYHFIPNLEAVVRYEWYDGDIDRSLTWGNSEYAWLERVMLGVGYEIVPERLAVHGYYVHHCQEKISSHLWNPQDYYPHFGEEAIIELQLSF